MSGELKLEPAINRFDFVEEVTEKDILNTKWNVLTIPFNATPIPEFERITFDSSYKVKGGLGDHWEYTGYNHVKIDNSIDIYFINKNFFFVNHTLKKLSIGIRDTILVTMEQIQQNKTDYKVYDEKFAIIMDKLNKDPAAKQAFFENPKIMLEQTGIPLVENLITQDQSDSGDMNVKFKWWGVDFIMSEELTKKVINREIETEALGALISAALIAGGIASALAVAVGLAFAAVLFVKYLELYYIDKGKGVHWPITWPQWAVFVIPPWDPVTLTIKGTALLHPLRN